MKTKNRGEANFCFKMVTKFTIDQINNKNENDPMN